MRGRKPKSIQQQINDGDPRRHGVNKLDEMLAREPQPTVGLPDCPDHLEARARAAWDFWKEELQIMRQNRRPDAMMLEGACVMYARAVDADLMIAKHGSIIAQPILDKEGHKVGTKIRNHPALAVSNASWKQVRAFCSEFGLSPSSRTRLSADRTADDADALDQLLNGERELPDRFNKVQ